ncbi:hypothetical protein N9948_00230 [bacterium]|nr:hypothetical protein [bacterium]
MRKELTFKDVSQRTDRIYNLERKLNSFSKRLKETKYDLISEMIDDLSIYENLEKEIQIQKCYFQMEEIYWNE